MSLKTLPILFLNLGGEMIYIIDQRLRAQNIPEDKATRVRHDILLSMMNKPFMEDLFKPQDVYSKPALRKVFDRLAHNSIMRIPPESMDKLYDLMIMALKYQVCLSACPMDVLMGTLNHMDAMREFAEGNDEVLALIEDVYLLIKDNYADLSAGQFQLIRHTILSFFQDMHIKVSLFLKNGIQYANGRFLLTRGGQVPWGSDVPGTIRTFHDGGQEKEKFFFKVPEKFHLGFKNGTFEVLGDRVTKLGTNMYDTQNPKVLASSTSSSSSNTSRTSMMSSEDFGDSTDLAMAGLNLLEYLIFGEKYDDEIQDTFRLRLIETDEGSNESQGVINDTSDINIKPIKHKKIVVDATTRTQREEISQLMDEFTIDAPNTDEDLVTLMDTYI